MRFLCLLLVMLLIVQCTRKKPMEHGALVFQSDFGLKDGAVSAMKGVAFEVSPELKMFDLTHEIPAYNIWEAAYRLHQTSPYWPSGTVFVSVVDPGVGSDRKSVVLKTKSGHYFVTPDNGTLTLIAEDLGIEEVREIDEAVNRRVNSGASYTFHGRDVYAYTAARLASGKILFSEVGPVLPPKVVSLPYQRPVSDGNVVKGNISILDIQYGNVWSNIDKATFEKTGAQPGDILDVTVLRLDSIVFHGQVKYVNTFSDVPVGEDMAYLNSLLNFSLGINQGNFSESHRVQSGPEWSVTIAAKK